ncbi:MAG: GNAT family N-acetyltransferase [bacterium]|nr:GNAT family N-acetyltransferase [bacterium]
MEIVGEQEQRVVVRGLRPDDLEAVIALDAKNTGRRREEFFKVKLQQNLAETGLKVSLAAEVDGCFCGVLLVRVYYGEFGAPEPVAVLDTLDVHPDFRRQGVGAALLQQLRQNLEGLRVSRLQTQVPWDSPELIGFFHRQGFHMADRLCLDLDITHA